MKRYHIPLLLGVALLPFAAGAEEFNARYSSNGILDLRTIARPENHIILGRARISLEDPLIVPYLMMGISLQNDQLRLDAGPLEQKGLAKLFFAPLSYSARSTIRHTKGDLRLDTANQSHNLYGVAVTLYNPFGLQMGIAVEDSQHIAPFFALSYQTESDWYFESRTSFTLPPVVYHTDWYLDSPPYPGGALFHSSFYGSYSTTPLRAHLALHLSYGTLVPLRPAFTLLISGKANEVAGGLLLGAAFPDWFNNQGAIIEEWAQLGGWVTFKVGSALLWDLRLNGYLYLPHNQGKLLPWNHSPIKVEGSSKLQLQFSLEESVSNSVPLLEGEIEVDYRYDNRKKTSSLQRLKIAPLIRFSLLPLVIEGSYHLRLLERIYPMHSAFLKTVLKTKIIEGSLAFKIEVEDEHPIEESIIESKLTAQLALLPPWGKLLLAYSTPVIISSTGENSTFSVSFTFRP